MGGQIGEIWSDSQNKNANDKRVGKKMVMVKICYRKKFTCTWTWFRFINYSQFALWEWINNVNLGI